MIFPIINWPNFL